MTCKLPFDVAVGSLHQLIEGMVPGEELVLTVQGEPKAIVTKPARTTWPCQPGMAKDTKHWMAPTSTLPWKTSRSTWNDYVVHGLQHRLIPSLPC